MDDYMMIAQLEIGKALFAVPWFPVAAAITTAAAFVIAIYEGGKSLVGNLALMPTFWRDYWRGNWFKGFSREYYASLRHYKPKPVALKPKDKTTGGDDGQG